VSALLLDEHPVDADLLSALTGVYGRYAVPLDQLRPVFAGERRLCERCAVAGRHRLGVTRVVGGGLVACLRCWRAHEKAGIWPSPQAPHDAARCWLCTPSVSPDTDPQVELWLAEAGAESPRGVVAARRDALVAASRAAGRRVERWQRLAERVRAAIAAGRPVLCVAAALWLVEQARSSRRGRRSMVGHVAAAMAVSGSRELGLRARPGRSETAELLGVSEETVKAAWAALVALGWCLRRSRGGALPLRQRIACGRSQDRAEFDLARRPDRLLATATAAQLSALTAQAGTILVELAERAEVLAEVARGEVQHARAALKELRLPTNSRRHGLWPAELQPGNFFPPPGGHSGLSTEGSGCGGLKPFRSVMINRYVPRKVRPSGRAGGAPRLAPERRKPRSQPLHRPRTLQWVLALALARDVREHPALRLQLARVRVDQLASTLAWLAAAGWTADDVATQVQLDVAKKVAQWPGYTPPTPPDLPLRWLKKALANADPTAPPAQAARAAKQAQGQRLAIAPVPRTAPSTRTTEARALARANAAAAAARAAVGRSAGQRRLDAARQEQVAAAGATLYSPIAAALDEDWPEVRQPPPS
jgi:hypothetical protein